MDGWLSLFIMRDPWDWAPPEEILTAPKATTFWGFEFKRPQKLFYRNISKAAVKSKWQCVLSMVVNLWAWLCPSQYFSSISTYSQEKSRNTSTCTHRKLKSLSPFFPSSPSYQYTVLQNHKEESCKMRWHDFSSTPFSDTLSIRFILIVIVWVRPLRYSLW